MKILNYNKKMNDFFAFMKYCRKFAIIQAVSEKLLYKSK